MGEILVGLIMLVSGTLDGAEKVVTTSTPGEPYTAIVQSKCGDVGDLEECKPDPGGGLVCATGGGFDYAGRICVNGLD